MIKRVFFFGDRFGYRTTELTRGILRYQSIHRRWRFDTANGLAPDAPNSLRTARERMDGVIVKAPSPTLFAAFDHLHVPAVQIDAVRMHPAVAACAHDDERVGAMGAEHLCRRGHRRLAFVGMDMVWCRRRFEGFRKNIGDRELYCTRTEAGWRDWDWLSDENAVGDFLRGPPKPIGLMAADDSAATFVLDAALAVGLRVPEDVAILGVNNDSARCDFAEVPLSSIDTDMERLGYLAAATLDSIMSGGPVPAEELLSPPRGVKIRRSTDHLAVDDPDVAAAVRYIWEHATEGISVEEVLKHVSTSRRTLERQFRATLGRLPHDEIRHVRLVRARDLLIESHLSLTDVAQRCGFFDSAHFTREFKQRFKMTPSAFRRAQMP